MLIIYRAYILYFNKNALFIDPWSNPQTLMSWLIRQEYPGYHKGYLSFTTGSAVIEVGV